MNIPLQLKGIRNECYNGAALRRLILLTLKAFITSVEKEAYLTQSKNMFKEKFGEEAYVNSDMLDNIVMELFEDDENNQTRADDCTWVNMFTGDLLDLARLTYMQCCYLRDLASELDQIQDPLKETDKDYTRCDLLASKLVACEKMLGDQYVALRNKRDDEREACKVIIARKKKSV